MFERRVPPGRSDVSSVLLACIRARLDEPAADRIRAAIGGLFDWDGLVALARRHAVSGLLLRGLEFAGVDAVDPGALAALEQDRRARIAIDLASARQLAAVISALADAGVPAAAYKGPCLSVQAYGRIGVRTHEDLDVLIPRGGVAAARAAMLALGYTRPAEALSLLDSAVPAAGREDVFRPSAPAGRLVELHCAVAEWPAAIDLPAAQIIARSTPVVLAGLPLPSPDREDSLLLLAIHGWHHEWSSLKLIADVDAIVQSGIDWDEVFRRARAARAVRIVRVALLLARALLETPLPDSVVREIGRDGTANWLARLCAARVLRDLNQPVRQVWRFYVQLLSRERAVDQARYIVRTAVVNWALRSWLSPRVRRLRGAGAGAPVGDRGVDEPE